MSMNRKGQITIFIVLGLIILGAIAGVIYFRNISWVVKEPNVKLDSSETILINYIEECLENTGVEGLELLGLQGGYYHVPDDIRIKHFSFDLAVYFSPSKTIKPNFEVMEKELSNYVENQIILCLDNFSVFKETGLVIKAKEKPQVHASFGENKVVLSLYYPLSLSRGTAESRQDVLDVQLFLSIDEGGREMFLDNFQATINHDFRKFFMMVEKTFSLTEDSPGLPLGALMHEAYQNNYNLEIDNLDKETALFIFLFDPGIKYHRPFVFNYAVKFPTGDIENITDINSLNLSDNFLVG